MKYKKGCTLLDQRYKEGESTWGCKNGVFDFDDVLSLLEDLKDYAEHQNDWELKEYLLEKSGFVI